MFEPECNRAAEALLFELFSDRFCDLAYFLFCAGADFQFLFIILIIFMLINATDQKNIDSRYTGKYNVCVSETAL